MTRGYFGVAVYSPLREVNIGSLWRTATAYEASFLATVGARYQRQASDTPASSRHTPLHHYDDIDDLVNHLPHECALVGVEMVPKAIPLSCYTHRPRALYLLGSEVVGLPEKVLRRCSDVIEVPTPREFSLNVAVAGSVVLYDRHTKRVTRRSRADLVPVELPAS